MEAILPNGLGWLTKHVPALALVILFMLTVAWIAVAINNFDHRLSETERVCNDINARQLPGIRSEIKELKSDVSKMKEDIFEIKLFMKKIDTYLSTKDKDYPK